MATVNQSHAATTSSVKQRSFSRRVWITVAIAAAVFVTFFIVWQALEILLALFAGILVAVFLHGASRFIAAHTPIPRKAALFVVLGLIIAAILLVGFVAFPSIDQQLDQMSLNLAKAWETLRSQGPGACFYLLPASSSLASNPIGFHANSLSRLLLGLAAFANHTCTLTQAPYVLRLPGI